MSMLITGASGQLGRRTAELLLKRVEPGEVVLASRNPDAVADLGAGETRFLDFDDAASLESAFEGVDRVLIVSSDAIGDRVDGHLAAIDAAVKAGASHLLYTSVPNPTDDNPAPVVDDHRRTEAALRESGVAWTALRNGLYIDLLADELAGAGASGVLAHNEGEGRTGRIAREDCAAVAAAVLADPEPFAGQALDVVGVDPIDAAERAAIYAEMLGRPVLAEHLDDSVYLESLREHGVPEEVATVIAGFGRAVREGALDQGGDVVERLVGRRPRTFAEVLGR